MPTRLNLKTACVLVWTAIAALVVHGYHPTVEDGEIYLPGIKRLLNPNLYPYNQGFFASHAHMTLFPNLIASSVRISHLPLDYALLVWQLLAIYLLLFACWRLGRLCFIEERAAWGAVALVAALLTLPVAGTSLYIMDQYLNTRSLSTPMVLLAIVNAIQRRWSRAAVWIVPTALIHPLMVVFGLAYMVLVGWMARTRKPVRAEAVAATALLLISPLKFFPPVTDAYWQAVQTREYFFLLRWKWYEWLGIFAPLLLLWWYRRIARRRGLATLEHLSSALIVFELLFFAAGLVITIPHRFVNFTLLQPMRALHLVYIIMFAMTGGVLAKWLLREKVWCWLVLFVPLCAGMWYVQRQIFPATPHLEFPWTKPTSDWVRTFTWVRDHTPTDAYFALNPEHMGLPGEDQHGFRAIAERSMLADAMKDSGAVSMFPQLAEEWRRQTRAEQGWNNFGVQNFERLKQEFGINWVVLEHPVAGMNCPYRNSTLRACEIR